MKVHELHARLGELIEQGHGDEYVYDNDGNDVCAALPPEPDDGDGAGDGVMLDCHVDSELRNARA